MNKLPLQTRVQILEMLCEGSSMRSISRICDVSINTVTKMLEDAGEVCLALHDELVVNVKAERVQCDEIWAYVHTKEANKAKAKKVEGDHGDVWTWTAIDADSKMILSYLAGSRSTKCAEAFIGDLARRLGNRVQLSTDGLASYLPAIKKAFGDAVDYAMIHKIFSAVRSSPEARYSPPTCIGTKKHELIGNPDVKHISTSYVERQNLNMRMGMRRFTRLTNAFSKKYANHLYALSLYFMFYNFVRIHKTLRTSPAMAAGVSDKLWSMEDIIAEMDARAPKPGPRGPYKKKDA